jgi:hypothetical protein
MPIQDCRVGVGSHTDPEDGCGGSRGGASASAHSTLPCALPGTRHPGPHVRTMAGGHGSPPLREYSVRQCLRGFRLQDRRRAQRHVPPQLGRQRPELPKDAVVPAEFLPKTVTRQHGSSALPRLQSRPRARPRWRGGQWVDTHRTPWTHSRSNRPDRTSCPPKETRAAC